MGKQKATLNKQKGYTLLEVTLFMAISGTLTLVAVLGLGPRLRNVRFTSAVRGVESSIQKQLLDFEAGVNTQELKKCQKDATANMVSLTAAGAGQAAGTNAQCILNGRLAVFKSNEVTYYPIISLRTGDPTCTATETGFTRTLCFGATIVGSMPTDVEYSNGATNNTGQLTGFGYLQDPESSTKYTFVYLPAASSDLANNTLYKIEATKVSTNSTPTANACLAIGSRRAKLEMINGSTRPKVTFEGCS